jgi:hypothetical protein
VALGITYVAISRQNLGLTLRGATSAMAHPGESMIEIVTVSRLLG